MGSPEGHDVAHPGSIEQPRRHRNRTSGGFLLRSPFGRPLSLVSISPESQQTRKGKQKVDDTEVNGQKRRSYVNTEQNGSIKSSPLRKEVQQRGDLNGSHPESSFSPSPSTNYTSTVQNGRPVSSNTRSTSEIGFDSDPAQIVDMALRLSEGRRRQASERRYVSADVSGQRVVSMPNGQTVQNRLPSSGIEPNVAFSASHQKETSTASDNPTLVNSSVSGIVSDQSSILEVSKATLARVEKAKTYIELAYQHRRLLPHLPPIRRPVIRHPHGIELSESKLYNPLQYARNRKLRLREKSGLTAEADGWYDVSKVREWVDAAINSHTETRHDPTECVRLPPLIQREDNNEHEEQAQPNSPPQRNQASRPRRPKSDWVTHPANLLADAYWLEQGLNKIKIQDRNNNNIYPPDTQFRYAGWRQHVTPVKVPESLQKETPSIPEVTIESTSVAPVPDAPTLPKFRSAHRKGNDTGHLSGPKKLKRSLISDAKDSTRKALEMFESTSRSSSDTESLDLSSDDDSLNHGGPKSSNNALKIHLPDGNPFSSPVSSRNDNRGIYSTVIDDPTLTTKKSRHQTSEKSRISKYLKKHRTHEHSSSDGDRSQQRMSYDMKQIQSEDQPRSSGEYGILSPASPINHGIPSIAINLSPTTSRSPSPTRNGHNMFPSLHEKHQIQDKEQVSNSSIVRESLKSHSRDPSTDADKSRNSSGDNSRGTSPFSKSRRGSSPYEAPVYSRADHRGSTISRTSTKSHVPSIDHKPRIRGMFKGGRIAEIVGTEVSKVGDYIWKRDPPLNRQPTSVSQISMRSYDSSASEDEPNGGLFKTPPRNARKSLSSNSSKTDPRRSLEGLDSRPSYNNPNLPSFTSPFQRDREKQDLHQDSTTPGTPKGSDGDHISLQVAQHRSRSKSPRFNRLAPPKLDTSGTTSNRSDAHDFGAPLDLTNSRSASQAYNEAIGRENHPVNEGRSGSVLDWSRIHDGRNSLVDKPNNPSRADVLRIEALLIMSIVKARGIMCTQQLVASAGSKMHNSLDSMGDQRLRQCKEHANAARDLMVQISASSDTFDRRLDEFSSTTVTNLQGEIQRLEDNIENALVPKARATADQIGQLGMKLTTTSTLAVNGLNETISKAFRLRKRGPFHWVRALGYGIIEWAVVSLLWIIWAVVTMVQIMLGTVRLGSSFIRWMFWID